MEHQVECSKCRWPYLAPVEAEGPSVCPECQGRDVVRARSERFRQWLGGLKKGDEVVVIRSHGGRSSYRTCAVERTTATQILVDSLRVRKENGRIVGSYYSGIELHPPTQTLALKAKQSAAIYEFQRFSSPAGFRTLKPEEIVVMMEALAAYREAHNGN